MRLLGTVPIKLHAYLLGKLSFLACWAALIASRFCTGLAWFRDPWLDRVGTALLVVGLLVMLAGVANLGRSLRVGLPEEQTALKTRGIFRLTRNPVYVGGLLTCLAAVAWTANPVVLALAAIAAVVHHYIVLSEERYLSAQFGDAWTDYAREVRRYL